MAIYNGPRPTVAKPLERRVLAATSNNTTGDGKDLIIVPPEYAYRKIKNIKAYVDTAGVTGQQDVQIHNVRAGADVLSTVESITTGKASSGGVINTANAEVQAGDPLRVDVDAIHSGTAAQGLTVVIEFA